MTDRDRRRQMPVPIARGTRGAVASPHHLATQAGIGILRAGGSAVDAAIATNAALAVVAGHSCGLGGDAFWLIDDPATGEVVALNGSGRSAAGATIEAAAAAGPDADARARALDGDRAGRRRLVGRGAPPVRAAAWADLLAPAIELADGFPASAGWIGAVERAAGDLRRRRRLGAHLSAGRPPVAPGRAGAAAGARAARCARSPPRVRRALYTGALARARGRRTSTTPARPIRARRPRRPPVRLGHAHRDHLSRPDLAQPPAQQLRRGGARDARHPRPPRAAAAGRVRRPGRGRRRAGSTWAWRRPASRSPTATAGSPTSTPWSPAPLERLPRPRPGRRARRRRIDPDRVGPRRRPRRCPPAAAPSISAPRTVTAARSASSSPTTPGSARGWSIPRPASATRTGARSSASTRGTPTRWRRASARSTR